MTGYILQLLVVQRVVSKDIRPTGLLYLSSLTSLIFCFFVF